MDATRLQTLERENVRLQRAVRELSILNDLSRAIGASHDTEGIIRTIIHRSLDAVSAEQGVITLVDASDEASMKTFVRTVASASGRRPLHVQDSLLGWMHLHKKALLINDPASDDRFRGVEWDASIRTLLSVPLVVRARLTGILTVYNKREPGGFTPDDQRLLSIIAGQSAQVIEHARLLEEEKQLLHIREEMRLAHEIQMNLLPTSSPDVPGYDIAGTSVAAQSVGGDYYDVIPVDARRVALCVGDVSGKGLPAALVMANVQATLRGQALADVAPANCLSRSNRLLCQSIRRGSFVTLFYGLLDTDRHRLRYANAGHNRPLLRDASGAVRSLGEGGLVLGFMPAFDYAEAETVLPPGATLLVFSDGLTEAMNPAREQFGDERLAALLAEHGDEPAQAFLDRLLRAVRSHAGTALQTDDITILVVRRQA